MTLDEAREKLLAVAKTIPDFPRTSLWVPTGPAVRDENGVWHYPDAPTPAPKASPIDLSVLDPAAKEWMEFVDALTTFEEALAEIRRVIQTDSRIIHAHALREWSRIHAKAVCASRLLGRDR